ncbi:hypothetical protein B0T26DRAFT_731922 [Lasiosphaeria miniovina]|uniref:Uncharacterized protein n=1 Tax=Lasiosphaeria miniovina TaxID=1954250 RepID=A0AA39ZU50_9PEZI|nr:uncharacterized protein B0T26DRAFT_731922 [Lasiosphaeria miniovina]KAK0703569.1 hypothetical protein B0T26DRAFT_731922 [Lasiosphaeria miniovina]
MWKRVTIQCTFYSERIYIHKLVSNPPLLPHFVNERSNPWAIHHLSSIPETKRYCLR